MRKILYILLIVLLIGIIVTVILMASKWRSEEVYSKVVIKGNYTISDKEILRYAGLENLQNVKSSEINENEIVEKLKIHPDIKKVFVVKSPPDEIHIDIIEKNPIAFVNLDGELNLIDEEIELIPFKNTGKVFDLPVINGLKSTKGKKFTDDVKTELKIAISILLAINKESKLLNDIISEINMSEKEYIVLYTHDNAIPIIIPRYNDELFSSSLIRNDLLKKINAMRYFFEEIYPDEKKENIEKINLSYSNQLIITYKE